MYVSIKISKSSALSISVLLIFEIQLINAALFLKANYLSYASSFGSVRVIVPSTTMYDLLKSHKSDWCFKSYFFVNIVWSSRLIMNFYPFLVINLGTLSDVVSNRFVIVWYSIFILCLKQFWIINNLVSFFWWYVNFCSIFFSFFFTFCFTY